MADAVASVDPAALADVIRRCEAAVASWHALGDIETRACLGKSADFPTAIRDAAPLVLAVPAPVAGRAQKRPYAQRKVRTTGRAWGRERSAINEARSAHAFETAFAASERDTAEASMRLLWRMKGTSQWCETGAAAVAEDAERYQAAKEVAALIGKLNEPVPPERAGRLSVEDVERVLLTEEATRRTVLVSCEP